MLKYIIQVEDFTDESQNVARAVGTEGFKKIYSCIHRSLQYLEAFSEGRMQGTKLKELLFGKDSVALDLDKSTTKHSVPNNSKQMKKMQLTKDLKGAENHSTTNLLVHNESRQTKKRRFTGLEKSKGVKRSKGAQLLDKKNFGENRGHVTTHLVPRIPSIASISHRLNSSTYHGPAMLPSVSAPNFTSFQGLHNPIPPSPLLSLLSPLGLNISHIQNPSASMLHSESIQGQHEHHPHSIQRTPWR